MTKKTVNIFWMNNSVTCADLLKIFGITGLVSKNDPYNIDTLDRKISTYGKRLTDEFVDFTRTYYQTNTMEDFLFGNEKREGKKKIVLTSNLEKSIETAIYTFGNLENIIIIPVPYIGDKNIKPLSVVKLKQHFQTILDEAKTHKLGEKRDKHINITHDDIKWNFIENRNDKLLSEVNDKKFNNEILSKILQAYDPYNIVIITDPIFSTQITKCDRKSYLDITHQIIEYSPSLEKKPIGHINIKTTHCDLTYYPAKNNEELKKDIAELLHRAKNLIYENCGFTAKILAKFDEFTSDYQSDLYWMNDSVTCADIIKIFGSVDVIKKEKSHDINDFDKKISSYGIELIKLFRKDKNIWKGAQINPKIILTSNLEKSIETAIYAFGYLDNVKIIPVPYIGSSKNKVSTVGELQKYFKDFFNIAAKNKLNILISYHNIDWKYIENVNYKSLQEINNNKFNEILSNLLLEQKPNNIVIITNGEFIKNRTRCKDINNLGVIIELLKYKIISNKIKFTGSKIDCDKKYYTSYNPEQIKQHIKEGEIRHGGTKMKLSNTYNNCNFPDTIRNTIHPPSIDYDKNESIRIHWMRHAVSCANVLKIFGLVGFKGFMSDPSIIFKGKLDPRSIYAKDSELSNYGIVNAKAIGNTNTKTNIKIMNYLFHDYSLKKGIEPNKIILTSNLKRTIETAIYAFGHLDHVKIIPVPYISEQSNVAAKIPIEFDESNIPLKVGTLRSYFKYFFESLDILKKFRDDKYADAYIKALKGRELIEPNISEIDRAILFWYNVDTIKQKQLGVDTIKNLIKTVTNTKLKIGYEDIDWSYMECYETVNDPMTEVSSEKFDREILPKILWEHPVQNIVAISHTNFITSRCKNKNIKECPKKINNLEVLTEAITYERLKMNNPLKINKCDKTNKDKSGHELIKIPKKSTWNTSVNKTIDIEEIKKFFYENLGIPSSVYWDNCKFPDKIFVDVRRKAIDIREKAEKQSKKFIDMNPIKAYGFVQTFLS